MKALVSTGNVAGLPFRGGFMSLDNADCATLIGAASGLVKTLFAAGLGALGLILAAAIMEEERMRKAEQISIGTMSLIRTSKRCFIGIPMDDEIEFECEENKLKIPLSKISEIRINSYFFGGIQGYNIELIDGSTYEVDNIITKQLHFISVAGKQQATFPGGDTMTKLRPNPFAIITGICTLGLVPFSFIGFRTRVKGKIIPSRIGRIFFNYQEYNPWGDGARNFSISGVGWSDIALLRQRLQFVFEHNREAMVNELGENLFNKYFKFEKS